MGTPGLPERLSGHLFLGQKGAGYKVRSRKGQYVLIYKLRFGEATRKCQCQQVLPSNNRYTIMLPYVCNYTNYINTGLFHSANFLAFFKSIIYKYLFCGIQLFFILITYGHLHVRASLRTYRLSYHKEKFHSPFQCA